MSLCKEFCPKVFCKTLLHSQAAVKLDILQRVVNRLVPGILFDKVFTFLCRGKMMGIVFKRRCDNDFVNDRLSSIKSENFSAEPSYKQNDSIKESANPPI